MASSAPSSDTRDIPLLGSSVHIVRRSASVLQTLLLTRFQCEVQILGLDLDSGPGLGSGKARMVPEKGSEFVLSSGVKVSVWKADLANFSAAAVVNAANSKLEHYGGLAAALASAGGPGFQKESDYYVQKNGNVRTGDAVALGAGKLQCKTVIHAVGPRLSYSPNAHEVSAAKSQLQRVIRSVLEIVEKKQLETVAIPAISSGIFNFPLAECADAIVGAVKSFYGSGTSHRFKPKEVLLVNNDDPTVKEMERACAQLLTPGSYSQAAASGTRPQTRGGAGAGARPPQIQFGPVRVLLRKGRLEEQKMDVIVNTIGQDRNLRVGQVSNMILKKAGDKMQSAIYSAPFSGSLIITNGFGLDCKEVYHACCTNKHSSGSEQALFRSVQDCLWTAAASNYSSIAFPAIGTGNLGFSDEEVARIMLHAALDVSQKCHCPLDVHFVIFPKDEQRFKAFEKELKSFQPKAFQTEPPQNVPEGAQSLNFKPALLASQEQGSAAWKLEDKALIRLQSSSEENLSEAEAWLMSRLFNSSSAVCIYDNFIQHLGEKELEELCDLEVEDVQVEEFLEKGLSGVVVSGNDAVEIAVAALRFEQKLLEVQGEFVEEEKEELKNLSRRPVRGERSPPSSSDHEVKDVVKQLRSHGLELIKVEKVENAALQKLFDLQKAQMPSRPPQLLLQLVPAHACHMICDISFRPQCAPPDEPALGEGLYFAADVTTALKLWTKRSDQLFYLFVAEVLKGTSGGGRPGLVLGPGPGPGSWTRCDSVERSGVTVVFSHIQTLPRFILVCKKPDWV
ncbi:protein mono-ADP-ribosyltransferase PARP9 isoform X2 [Eucyclogobius newberryi]|uniref:protein mono-ADP-ribosyltransferase PARP9 isoform X2 n=1 Tax=Eucyclogobius newberryi TaxID=166745 RepID=UPI003B5C0663